MIVSISVCTDTGWSRLSETVPDGSDLECYALPRDTSRSKFWSHRMRQYIPEGRVLVWEVIAV